MTELLYFFSEGIVRHRFLRQGRPYPFQSPGTVNFVTSSVGMTFDLRQLTLLITETKGTGPLQTSRL